MKAQDLTADELKAIAALQRVAKTWPKSLWLFSASGSLNVMKKNAAGDMAETAYGGFDQEFSVAKINIQNDGGDW